MNKWIEQQKSFHHPWICIASFKEFYCGLSTCHSWDSIVISYYLFVFFFQIEKNEGVSLFGRLNNFFCTHSRMINAEKKTGKTFTPDLSNMNGGFINEIWTKKCLQIDNRFICILCVAVNKKMSSSKHRIKGRFNIMKKLI